MSAQAIESPDQKALARTLSAIDRLGLNENLIELDAQGYTTIRGVLSEEDNLLADVDREWFHSLFARTAPAFLATLLGLLTIDDEAAQTFYLQAAATVEEEECIEKS